MAEAGDAAPVAERAGERLAERDRRILGGVVLIDMQVAGRAQADVDQRVARELLEHMIEEADAGRDLIGAGAVEVDLDRDVGFARLAVDRGGAHGL